MRLKYFDLRISLICSFFFVCISTRTHNNNRKYSFNFNLLEKYWIQRKLNQKIIIMINSKRRFEIIQITWKVVSMRKYGQFNFRRNMFSILIHAPKNRKKKLSFFLCVCVCVSISEMSMKFHQNNNVHTCLIVLRLFIFGYPIFAVTSDTRLYRCLMLFSVSGLSTVFLSPTHANNTHETVSEYGQYANMVGYLLQTQLRYNLIQIFVICMMYFVILW